ncbi:hypothetical protein [Shewanella sp.]|uniref:hypothetical protein n=2 Tax=Shewanella sp. TaxID=50422 RepID=UPI0040545337
MFSRVLTVECPGHLEKQYVNTSEIYAEQYRAHYPLIYSRGWEHEDCCEVAERYCEQNSYRLLRSTESFTLDIPLVMGPQVFLLDRLNTKITTGNNFRLELVFCDGVNQNAIGKLDLYEHIKNLDMNSGKAELAFKCDRSTPLTWLRLKSNEVMSIRISGEIRIRSSIDLIIQLEGE